MNRKRGFIIALLGLFVLLTSYLALAQDNVTVPDVTGMALPQAAALLNRSGLLLGAENNEGWTAASGLQPGVISGQSVAAGESVARGAAVDVNVLRAPNAALIYDDNDLTLVNLSEGSFDLNTIRFNSEDGKASFTAARWGPVMAGGDCGQVWSIGRSQAKDLPECDSMQWLTTNRAEEHFWTGAGGVTRFMVAQSGVVRATCNVANPGRCDFYLASSGAGGDFTDYVYFAYTTDRLIVYNRSTDKWMPLGQLTIQNNNLPNPIPFVVGDPALYAGQNPQIIGDVTRLAPEQCIYFDNTSPQRDAPPQSCDVIARFSMGPDIIFWAQAFDFTSITDEQTRSCPAAEAGKLTLCIMPR